VFRPRSDSRLLAGVVAEATPYGGRVLDLCTGSGIVALSAALAGAGEVVAVDLSRRCVATAGLNARLNGLRIDGRRGDLYGPVRGEQFDVITANPPYLPGTHPDKLGAQDPARAWEGGPDGRVLLDRIIDGAGAHLLPGGLLLVVHSSVCGVEGSLDRMARAGLRADVVHRQRGPMGPLLGARVLSLEARRLLEQGERTEEIVVVRGEVDGRP
jgi:release factor glutamine methyltransferase